MEMTVESDKPSVPESAEGPSADTDWWWKGIPLHFPNHTCAVPVRFWRHMCLRYMSPDLAARHVADKREIARSSTSHTLDILHNTDSFML
jgi:hypothetical protein